MNTITIMGAGNVGLVTAACFSEFGLQVTCMDRDKRRISDLRQGEIPFYEPGLGTLVAKSINSGRLRFTDDVREAVGASKIIFIAVGTPLGEDGSLDMSDFFSVVKDIAAAMTEDKVVVYKSTVPVGTGRRLIKIIQDALDLRGCSLNFHVISNPEFLREGSAIRDFLHPDRVVIGANDGTSSQIMRDIYRVLYLIDTPFIFTTLETAELIKYASNAYLATKITFINEIANLCDAVGADVHAIAKAMGLDARIGKYFLHPGPGFGGGCLPKDTKTLVKIGYENGVQMRLAASVIEANEYQIQNMIRKIRTEFKGLKDKVIAILGISFKPDTDDIREAPSIPIIINLLREGSRVRVFDPAAMDNAKRGAFKAIERQCLVYCDDEYEAATGADGIVIMTEWNQFRHLDLKRMREIMAGIHVFDFRNIFEPSAVMEAGLIHKGVGR